VGVNAREPSSRPLRLVLLLSLLLPKLVCIALSPTPAAARVVPCACVVVGEWEEWGESLLSASPRMTTYSSKVERHTGHLSM
jgi:hypothetical protein